jgi:hypothetical protein
MSSNANGKMMIPDQGNTSTYKLSLNHSRNVNKPNKDHKIMVVGDRFAPSCVCDERII